MKATDFLTILGLALAAWSIIPRKERKFILLFFSKREIGFFIFLLIYIHWLFAFEWVLENWWSELSIFTHSKGIPAAAWSYIFILFTIGYPVVKVLTGFFPKSRSKSVLRLYNELLDQGEIQILADYIIKYHINDVETYLKKYSQIPDKDILEMNLGIRTKADEQEEKLVKKARMAYARSVYYGIIHREEFIKKAALAYPDIFAQAIRGMESTKVSDEYFVKAFLNTLIDEKSPQLIVELKIMENSSDALKQRLEYNDLPILEGVFNNLPVAVKNAIWYPFGKKGVHDLEYNKETKAFLAQKFDGSIKEQLWNHRIYSCIVFFNYMVREAIYREVKWHMWLFYYNHFTQAIIENIPKENEYDQDSEWPSFNHYLIYQMFHNMKNWLELALKEQTTRRIIDSLKCMGKVLKQLSEADGGKISPRFKQRIFDSAIHIYFADMHIEQGEGSALIRQWIEIALRDPEQFYKPQVNVTPAFRAILIDAWDHFDKVPYEGHSQDLLDQFQTNVIDRL